MEDQQLELSEEKVLEMIESSYPNPITLQEMAKLVLPCLGLEHDALLCVVSSLFV